MKKSIVSRQNRYGVRLSTAGLLCAGVLASSPAFAEIDEIIVTGTKRDIGLQDVPIAVTAVTAEQIGKTFKDDIRALSNVAPNLLISQQTGFNAALPGIRGSGAISILVTQDSSTAILIDDFPLNHVQSQLLELVDIEQVEIFRGPQGTLFGKNTSSGALNITTKKPVFGEFEGEVSGKWSRFSVVDGRDAAAVKGAVNIPIFENKLALRLSAIYDYSDGVYTNDKDTATFPEDIPIFGACAPNCAALLPPGLDTNTKGTGEALNGKDVFAGRAKLRFQPFERYDAQFTYEIVRDRSDSPPGVNETPADQGFLLDLLGFPGIQTAGTDDKKGIFSTGVTNQENGIFIQRGHRVNVDGYYLTQDLTLTDSLTVKSITGYREQEETLPSTFTGEAFNNLFDATRNTERETFHQEVRLASDFDGPFNFVAGANYDKEEVDFRAFATVGLSAPLTGDLDFINDPSFTGAAQDRTTWAIYGDGSFDFTEKFTLSGGLRFTSDKKEFDRFQNPGGPGAALTPVKDQVFVGPDCLDAGSNRASRFGLTGAELDQRNLPAGAIERPAFGLVLQGAEAEFEELTWRVALDYKWTEEVLTYVTVSTGFLSGGFTETCSSEATCQPFQPEKSRNVEGGIKADLLDNTLRLNLAAFWMRYEDLQRNQVVPFTNAFGITTQETITVNAGKSRAVGLELESTYTPPMIEGLTLNFNLGYFDHDYKEFALDLDGDGDLDLAEIVDLNGDGQLSSLTDLEVPFSSEFTVSGGFTYEYPVLGGRAGDLTTYFNVHHRTEAELLPFNTVNSQLEAMTDITASLTWTEPEGRYYLTAFGKNLANQVKRTTSNPVAGLWIFSMFSEPRQVGLEFGFNF